MGPKGSLQQCGKKPLSREKSHATKRPLTNDPRVTPLLVQITKLQCTFLELINLQFISPLELTPLPLLTLPLLLAELHMVTMVVSFFISNLMVEALVVSENLSTGMPHRKKIPHLISNPPLKKMLHPS